MDAGKLDRKITIQEASESRDDFGGVQVTWGTYATRWANVNYTKKAGEAYDPQRKTSNYTILFTVRSDSTTRAITPKMRILFDSKLYDIRAVSEVAREFRKMFLMIEAEYTKPDTA